MFGITMEDTALERWLLVSLWFGVPFGILMLYWFATKGFDRLQKAGINGPKPLPIIGNLVDVLMKQIHVAEEDFVRKYGKVCGYYLGCNPVVLMADPKVIRQVLIKDFHKFSSRPPIELGILCGPGKYSLMHVTGEDHKRIRATLTPTFSPAKMKKMVPILREHISVLMEKMEELSNSKKSADTYRLFSLFTMESMFSSAFGMKTDIQRNPNNPYNKQAAKVLEPDMLFLLSFIFPRIQTIIKFVLTLIGGYPSIRFIADACRRIIKERRSKNAESSEQRNDLLQALLTANSQTTDGRTVKLSDDEVLSQAITFMLAGHETTSNSLAFASYALAMNPDVQEKLYEELNEHFPGDAIPGYEEVSNLPYMEMFFSEVLRLYGPVFRFDRQCSESCTIEGINFKKGFTASVALTSLHMDPEIWPEPEKFNPLRFSPEAKASRDSMCYLPFGAGQRVCIGMRFAWFQTKMALAFILKKYKFVRGPDTQVPPVRVPSIGLFPRDGIWLEIVKRNNDA